MFKTDRTPFFTHYGELKQGKMCLYFMAVLPVWAAPIVPELKSNGLVCICRDYKIIRLQQLAKPDMYQLSKLDITHSTKRSSLQPL